MARRRGWISVATFVVCLLGLACRTPFAPTFAVLYAGDVLWGALFYLLLALRWPASPRVPLTVGAAVTTVLIELSQLYRAPWAEQVRGSRVGGLLLGHGFSWSDVICVALGAGLAALLDGWWTVLRSRAA